MNTSFPQTEASSYLDGVEDLISPQELCTPRGTGIGIYYPVTAEEVIKTRQYYHMLEQDHIQEFDDRWAHIESSKQFWEEQVR